MGRRGVVLLLAAAALTTAAVAGVQGSLTPRAPVADKAAAADEAAKPVAGTPVKGEK